ncbi:MAG: hypothetical protein ABMA14_26050, partial [Hyphomonadaceae bacterium]
MLCAFAWLVSNVVSMLATIFNRNTRDWHTDAAHEDQLPTSNAATGNMTRREHRRFQTPHGMSSTRSMRPSSHEGVLTSGS